MNRFLHPRGSRANLALSLGLVFALVFSPLAPAADAGLVTLDSTPTRLGDHIATDKWTVVMLWTTYCGVCREQQPMMSAFHDAHRANDAVVIGIALDGHQQMDAVRAYVAGAGMSFESFVGDVDAIATNFEAMFEEPFKGTPTYLVFNPRRELVAYKTGPLSREELESYIAADS